MMELRDLCMPRNQLSEENRALLKQRTDEALIALTSKGNAGFVFCSVEYPTAETPMSFDSLIGASSIGVAIVLLKAVNRVADDLLRELATHLQISQEELSEWLKGLPIVGGVVETGPYGRC